MIKKYILTLTFFVTPLLAVENPTALFLLDTGQNLRLYSMGNIFSSISPDDAFHNPWVLGWAVNSGVSFYQWPGTLDGSKYRFLGTLLPYTDMGPISLGYLNYSAGEETVEELDGTIRTIKIEEDSIFSVGYGFRVGQKFFLGGNAKYLKSTLADEYNADTFLADFGASYYALNDRYVFGIGIRNIGGNLKYYQTKESLPTEIKLGHSYSFKPMPGHKILCGFSITQVLENKMHTFSAGFEYFPGNPLLALRGGIITQDGDITYTGGIGISLNRFNFDVGYKLSENKDISDSSSVRFSLNFILGKTDDYSRAEKYLKKRGMRDKAIALWKNIEEDEKYYASAQKLLKRYMYPPVLKIYAKLKDSDGDGILQAGESGNIAATVVNSGKSEAKYLKIKLIPQETGEGRTYEASLSPKTIEMLPPHSKKTVKFPVKALMNSRNEKLAFKIVGTELRGFNPSPVPFYISTREFPPPVPVLARYTFREDNTGNSIGNGNGIIEKGEQIELTGYIVNAGKSASEGLEVIMKSGDENVEVLPELSSVKIGSLKPGEYRKVVFGFKVKDFPNKKLLPLEIRFNDKRPKYSRTQCLQLETGSFYRDPIEPFFTDIDIDLATLPILAGPIPGTRAKEIIMSESGAAPDLKYEVKILSDENENGIFEPGENLIVRVKIQNTGKGRAEDVRIEISGDNTISRLLGNSKYIGSIEPGTYQIVRFFGTIPSSIPRKEAVFNIKVKEGNGFSPLQVYQKSIALMPKEVKVVKELPKIVPWPVAYKDMRKNAGVVVVGISNYKNVEKLQYARKDAELVAKYINGVIGIPEKNIKTYYDSDATKSIIETSIKSWLAKKKFNFVVFYFAGHGYPDPENPKSGEPFIIPCDGNLDLGKGTLVSLNEIISTLEESPAKNILVVLDACFSGAGGRTPVQFAKLQRGIAIEPKYQYERATVLSATSGNQPSWEFDRAGHGYFTYYFLLGLKGKADKNNDGWVSLPEIYDFVSGKLGEELEGKQTPQCINEKDFKLGKYK